MDFHMRMPRNGKEFILFLGIVSIVSVIIIAPLITMLEIGFSMNTWLGTLKVLPTIWVFVVILVLLTHGPAEKLANKIVAEGDSFNSKITINVLCNVLLMSIFMTVIGTWIGMRSINFDIFKSYFHVWPRNFSIALGVELLIAQPIARFVLLKLHQRIDRTTVKAA